MPSDFRPATVSLAAIDVETDGFRITTNSGIGDLVAALSRVGITNAPILKCLGDGYQVVCGFRRIAAARTAGWQTIPSRILPEDADPVSCALMAITENSIERSLNLIEISRALRLLDSLIPDRDALLETASDAGLPGNPSLFKKIRPLCDLPEPLQAGLLTGTLALPSVQMLSKLRPETATVLSEFLAGLKLGLHKQRELIEIIIEISKREDCDIESILASPDISAILDDSKTDLPQKTGLIRWHLKQRRYPSLSRAQVEFDELKSQLKLGQHVSLKAPPGFESNRYTLSFTFGSPDELAVQYRTLGALSKNQEFCRFLSSRDSRRS